MAPSTKGSKKAVSADEALVDLLAQAPPGTAFIVTRNSRREAIEAYLETLHLGATVAVRSVKREHKDKADVALELLAGDPDRTAVFADDDVHELLHPAIADLAVNRRQLTRVLFAPGSLN